jgi:hypothetical protein
MQCSWLGEHYRPTTRAGLPGHIMREEPALVYMSMLLVKANEAFAPTEGFNSGALADALGQVSNVADAAKALGLESVVATEWQQPLLDFLESIPPSIDATIMAATRNALERGVRVTISWQPAAAFEVRVWDVTKFDNGQWVGMVNVHILSPDPETS